MRLLIFLLALSSAFFVSSVYSEPDLTDLWPPTGEAKYCVKTSVSTNTSNGASGCDALQQQAKYFACVEFAKTYIYNSNPAEYSWGDSTCILESGSYKIKTEGTRNYSDGTQLPTWEVQSLYFSNFTNETVYECPPDGRPEYEYVVADSSHPSGQMCAKEKSNCPTPTDNDPFVFGTGGQTEKCFKNPDGTQCKIETDENGGYYIPISYGSAEPVQCARPPDKEVDKTSPPDDKPAPEETDDTPEMAELDALNKINDNLDAMNENQVAASDSNDERLDRVSEEIQIGNEILGEIRYNTDLIESNTDDTNDLLGETNDLLADILDNTGGPPPCIGDDCEEPDTFTITAERKNTEKGLNSIFTDEQRQVITDEIDEKKQEIEDYFEQIESESSSLFDINPSLGGGYEERIEVIKGVEVDMGLGRLASFFQLIAAAVMLCSTLTALYILLGP